MLTPGQAIAHGGRREYDAVRKLVDSPPDQTIKMAAMRAIGAVQDSTLAGSCVNDLLKSLAHTLTSRQRKPGTTS